MNQTLLIALGVTIFTMTIVGVLIYFYALFDRLAHVANASEADVVALRVIDDTAG